MENSRSFEGINRIADIIFFLAYVNFLWLVFTVAGLVILGLFPATIAMLSVIRKRIMGKEVATFSFFWSIYKKEFVRGNILGYIVLIVSYSFYVEYTLINSIDHAFLNYFMYPFITLNLFFVLTVIYLLPVYVHYELKLIRVIKNAFFIMLVNPFTTITAFIGILVISYLLITFPFIAFFFGGSILAYFVMFVSMHAFSKNESMSERIE